MWDDDDLCAVVVMLCLCDVDSVNTQADAGISGVKAQNDLTNKPQNRTNSRFGLGSQLRNNNTTIDKRSQQR